MTTADVQCPLCRAELEVAASLADQPMRCGRCRGTFRLPKQLQAEETPEAQVLAPKPVWERVRTGLSLTFFGGTMVLLTLILTVSLLVLFFLTADEDLLRRLGNPNNVPGEVIVLTFGILAMFGVGMLSLLVILIGSLLVLAVPVETKARGWLAGSVSCLLVAGVFLLAVVAVFIPISLQLEKHAEPPDGTMTLLGVFMMMAGLLTFLSAIAYGRFLVRLALYLRSADLAWSATNYSMVLMLTSGFGLCGLCLADLVSLLLRNGGLIARLSLAAVAVTLLVWWLTLLYNLRDRVTQGLAAAR